MEVHTKIDTSNLFSGKDLVVVITGGGTGIGLAFASGLVQTSAKRVYILGRRLEVLQKAAKDLDASGEIVIPVQCDVADIESVRQAAAKVEQDVGYVDVLVNNAGVSGPDHQPIHKAETVDDLQNILLGQWDKWESTMAINTASVVGVSAAFLKLLDAANGRRGFATGKVEKGVGRSRKDVQDLDKDDKRTSQIITVASIAAFNRYVTAGLAYNSSKAGAAMIGKSLSTLLASWGIRSNVICPGLFPSEMTADGNLDQDYPFDQIPAHRSGNFNEMAGTLLYLVGKAGAYVNGTMQVVDGGRLSVMPATY